MYHLDQLRHANWTCPLIKWVGLVALWTCFLTSLINVTAGILNSLFRKYQWIRSKDNRQADERFSFSIWPCRPGTIGLSPNGRIKWDLIILWVEYGHWERPEVRSRPAGMPQRKGGPENGVPLSCWCGEREGLSSFIWAECSLLQILFLILWNMFLWVDETKKKRA